MPSDGAWDTFISISRHKKLRELEWSKLDPDKRGTSSIPNSLFPVVCNDFSIIDFKKNRISYSYFRAKEELTASTDLRP